MKLEEIENPLFLKTLSIKEMNALCEEIREFIINNVSKTGGHLSSNLGVVELTVGIHYVFNTPSDKIIFDVGHQCYTHKILTGRAKDFSTLRQYNGLSGFISTAESSYDIWESGHCSTSIGAQCGYLLAQKADHKDDKVITVIGDASIANGVSFEALNYMGSLKDVCPIIILNDNKMSISNSVGAASRTLSRMRSSRFYQQLNSALAKSTPHKFRSACHRIKTSIKGLVLKENIFEDWGFDYMGPYNGNDLNVVIKTLKAAKALNKPCVIHFVTKKGKGYKYAEDDKVGAYHGVGKFDIETGKSCAKTENLYSYSKIFTKGLENVLAKEPAYVITPAMKKGCELDYLSKMFPQNVFDVGIAEEHATVMACAMAQQNKKVFLLLYSTFAQRAYDYLLNDIARTNTHVVVGIDRADIVPGDGPTHQGIYDIGMFNTMPNFQICMPKDGHELLSLIEYASNQNGPIAIRYPKGDEIMDNFAIYDHIQAPTWTVEKMGKSIVILTYGENVSFIKNIVEKNSIDAMIINCRFIRPIDTKMMDKIVALNLPVLIYENVVKKGGFTVNVYQYLIDNSCSTSRVVSMGLEEKDVLPCGDVDSLRKAFSLDEESVLKTIKNMLL